MTRSNSTGALVLGWLLLAAPAVPAAGPGDGAALLDLSIEELLAMEVTSASRKRQSLSRTAAAMTVITRDDIRRSGARSVPEALRLVPGLQVAQIDANKWAISARGFMGRFANKLLVLMDGRTLYTPSFSGVFWDVQDTLLDNIERIEVIRGPGGTLWGTNAVNGIINIITRDARQVGDLAMGEAGDRGSAAGAVRLAGGDAGVGGSAFLKCTDAAGNEDLAGADTADDWRQVRAGGRLDWSPRDGETLSLAGEAYSGDSGETLDLGSIVPPYRQRLDAEQDVSGAFARGRWQREWAPGRETLVQVVMDATRRATVVYGEDRDTVEAELQHRLALGSIHDVVAGISYRHNRYQFAAGDGIRFPDPSRNDSLWAAFVQDEMSLFAGRLLVTVGSKFERNELSDDDLEMLPTLRASWEVAAGHDLWGAVTRSVRTPSYGDMEVEITGLGAAMVLPPLSPQNPLPLPVQVQIAGSEDFRSETLTAWEAGYRGRLGPAVSLDVAAFLNVYDDLRDNVAAGLFCDSTGEPVDPLGPPPPCVFSSTSLINRLAMTNAGQVKTVGLELAVDWRATDRLRVTGAYAWIEPHAERVAGTLSPSVAASSPRQQATVRTDLALAPGLDAGLSLRFTDDIAVSGVDACWDGDLRLAWRPADGVELSLAGHNLLHDGRLQFRSELNELVPVAIQREVTAGVRWDF